jgi:hypothetical protein
MTVRQVREALFPKLSREDFYHILWEYTAFPCASPELVIRQLREYRKHHLKGA